MIKYSSHIHHGKNLKKIRELLGLKQEVLAIGLDITQQSVSEIEQKEIINKKTLDKISEILKIPAEAIENLNEKLIIDYINQFIKDALSVNNNKFEGRIVKFFREYLNLSEADFAQKLEISEIELIELEKQEKVPDLILKKIAGILKVPVEAIKNMTDEATNNYINTFNDNSTVNGIVNYNPTFNPIDKIVELYSEKEELYKQMLKDKDILIEKLSKKS